MDDLAYPVMVMMQTTPLPRIHMVLVDFTMAMKCIACEEWHRCIIPTTTLN